MTPQSGSQTSQWVRFGQRASKATAIGLTSAVLCTILQLPVEAKKGVSIPRSYIIVCDTDRTIEGDQGAGNNPDNLPSGCHLSDGSEADNNDSTGTSTCSNTSMGSPNCYPQNASSPMPTKGGGGVSKTDSDWSKSCMKTYEAELEKCTAETRAACTSLAKKRLRSCEIAEGNSQQNRTQPGTISIPNSAKVLVTSQTCQAAQQSNRAYCAKTANSTMQKQCAALSIQVDIKCSADKRKNLHRSL